VRRRSFDVDVCRVLQSACVAHDVFVLLGHRSTKRTLSSGQRAQIVVNATQLLVQVTQLVTNETPVARRKRMSPFFQRAKVLRRTRKTNVDVNGTQGGSLVRSIVVSGNCSVVRFARVCSARHGICLVTVRWLRRIDSIDLLEHRISRQDEDLKRTVGVSRTADEQIRTTYVDRR
jgi:hypothetical protein